MAFQEQPDDLRRSWALAEFLPDYPRALALWSSPVLVEAHTVLAFDLLRRVGRLPLSRSPANQQFLRLLTVIPVAACAAASKTDSAFFIGGKVGRNLRRMPDRYGSICLWWEDARGRCQRRRS